MRTLSEKIYNYLMNNEFSSQLEDQEFEKWENFIKELTSVPAREPEEQPQHSPVTTEAQEQIDPIVESALEEVVEVEAV